MIRGAPLLAVIPVRGGSKGIPGKNLLKFGGLTLLERAILLGKSDTRIDRITVSTDNEEMHAIAGAYGVAAPTLRPAELATDTAKTSDVVLHLIEQIGMGAGHIVLLQVTSPLRRRVDLRAFLDLYESSKASAVVSVVRHEEPRPEKLQKIVDSELQPYMGTGFEGPRQGLPQAYALNGAFYAISVENLRKSGKFLPPGTVPFVMEPAQSHNLDTSDDLQILEAMTAAKHWTFEAL